MPLRPHRRPSPGSGSDPGPALSRHGGGVGGAPSIRRPASCSAPLFPRSMSPYVSCRKSDHHQPHHLHHRFYSTPQVAPMYSVPRRPAVAGCRPRGLLRRKVGNSPSSPTCSDLDPDPKSSTSIQIGTPLMQIPGFAARPLRRRGCRSTRPIGGRNRGRPPSKKTPPSRAAGVGSPPRSRLAGCRQYGGGFRRESQRRPIIVGEWVLLGLVVAVAVAEDTGDPDLRPQVGNLAEAGPLEEHVRVRHLPEPAGEASPSRNRKQKGRVVCRRRSGLRRDRPGVGEDTLRHGIIVLQEPVAQARGFREGAP
ncbi:hypothetical protein BT93_E1442 [Corymbia citriodora subsp. variegata]|nr:hypothetical protein BT93_E1442 [Corymbia citriodora subsp. variegata]